MLDKIFFYKYARVLLIMSLLSVIGDLVLYFSGFQYVILPLEALIVNSAWIFLLLFVISNHKSLNPVNFVKSINIGNGVIIMFALAMFAMGSIHGAYPLFRMGIFSTLLIIGSKVLSVAILLNEVPGTIVFRNILISLSISILISYASVLTMFMGNPKFSPTLSIFFLSILFFFLILTLQSGFKFFSHKKLAQIRRVLNSFF